MLIAFQDYYDLDFPYEVQLGTLRLLGKKPNSLLNTLQSICNGRDWQELISSTSSIISAFLDDSALQVAGLPTGNDQIAVLNLDSKIGRAHV